MLLSDEIVIDGSHGEGGGQILRTGLTLSAITGKPVKIINIRANRPKPGLANQHLTGSNAIKDISGAIVDGNSLGSTSISFSPTKIEHGEYEFRVETAGAITLVLQTILPALASVKGLTRITVTGGTDVKWSPPIDYYRLALFPLLKRFGMDCNLKIKQRGYYPKGGGEAEVTVDSRGNRSGGLNEERTEPGGIRGIINITDLPLKIAERIKRSITESLPDKYSPEINIEHTGTGKSQGVGVVLAATGGNIILGASSLGERGKPAEKVGKEAAGLLMREINSGSSVDMYMADQLLPYMAFANPGSSYITGNLTKHTLTNIWTIQQFLGDVFEIEEKTNITIVRKR